MSSSDDLRRNIEVWTQSNADYTDASAHEAWAREEITWGVWEIPESELEILGDVTGLDAVELGCGTAYFSAWLAKRGARVVGVDPTPAQLETARRMQVEFGLEFRLLEAPGEQVPLPDASFDLVHSEYGAAIWADPHRWIPEAARLLRPGGRLIFLRGTPLSALCAPEIGAITTELQREYFGMYRFDWTHDDGGIEFHLGYGDMIRLLRNTGFEIEDLVELQAPQDAQTHEYYSHLTAEWARKWPAEEVWVARKPASV
jgi:SAM-dependent methyltransferase